jgi:hypothetical protein
MSPRIKLFQKAFSKLLKFSQFKSRECYDFDMSTKYKSLNLFHIIASLSISQAALAYECGKIEETGSLKTYTLCDAQGIIERIEKRFKKTGTPASIQKFENEKLISKEAFNIDHELVSEYGYEHPDSDTFFKVKFIPEVFPRVEIERVLYRGSAESKNPLKLSEWMYLKDDFGKYKLKAVDHFEGDLIVKRDIYVDAVKTDTYVYRHPEVVSIFKYVEGFTGYDINGVEIKRYDTNQSIDVSNYVKSRREKSILNDQSRRRMAVLDSGFDVSHKDLAHKFFLNPKDPIDGIDNDQNGIVDDLLGWKVSDQGDFSNNINESVSVRPKGTRYSPFSHGTHVSTIALDGVNEFALTAFSGNMSDANHLNKISDVLLSEKIEFVNMSFSFGSQKDSMAPPRASYDALQNMIEVNRDTVFTVAAGNAGQDLDNSGFTQKEYPAFYDFENILTVGALDSSKSEEFRMPYERPADFATYGEVSVDIFSPGQNVSGAAVGGGTVEVSGSSMASPYTLNVMLKIAVEFPSLSPIQIKHVVLYSAYTPDIYNPFPCISGGMLFPRRAFEVGRLVSSKGLTAKNAALEARQNEAFLLAGERVDDDYLNSVKELWSQRGL